MRKCCQLVKSVVVKKLHLFDKPQTFNPRCKDGSLTGESNGSAAVNEPAASLEPNNTFIKDKLNVRLTDGRGDRRLRKPEMSTWVSAFRLQTDKRLKNEAASGQKTKELV